MTDAELESQITDQTIIDATWGKPAEPTAKEKEITTDPVKSADPDPKKDLKDAASSEDPLKEAPLKKEVPDGIKNLLAKKNEERRLKNDALDVVKKQEWLIDTLKSEIEALKNPKDDDTMSDSEREEKLLKAMNKVSIAEDKRDDALEKTKTIDTTDETIRLTEVWEFLNQNPELIADKAEIVDLAKSYPTLPMDQVHKLRLANTDPSKLISEQERNKIKWWYNLAGQFDRSKTDWKDPSKMSDDELEASLQSTFAGWKNPLGG